MKKTIFNRIMAMLCMVVALVGCKDKNNYPYTTNYLPVQLPGSEKWSILDVNSGELIVKDAFNEAPSPVIDDMFYVMNDDGTFNYYNVANPKTPVNKEPFGSVTVFSEDGVAVASRRGEVLCVIDKNCEVVKKLPRDVSQCSMFSRGMAAFQNDLGKWGYIDVKGDTVIGAKFETANLFINEDMALVVDEKLVNDSSMSFSVIDKAGKELFNASTMTYRPINPYFVDGVLPVVKHSEKGDTIVCLDKAGKEVANPNADNGAVKEAGYKDFSRTAGGLFLVINKNDKMGLVDEDNNTLIEAKHDRISDLRKDRYIVGKDTLFNLVDDKGAAVGNVKFVHAHGGSESIFATRGFLDTDLAAASMLSMLSPNGCAGATAETTLMDMNGILPSDATQSAGQNTIAMPQGPFVVRYLFDKEISTLINKVASYNYDARVLAVDVSFNAISLDVKTEDEIVSKVSSAMGRCGFVLGNDQMFYNDAGQAVTLGYSQGVVSMGFFMHASDARPMPREARK